MRIRRLSLRVTGFATPPERLRRSVPVLHRKPVRKLFPATEIGVSPIVHMPDLMNQNVVQVVIADRFCCPAESPQRTGLFPATAEHFGFNSLSRPRLAHIVLLQGFFNRVQIHCRAPLHSIAWKQSPLASHPAQLHHVNAVTVWHGELQHTLANILGSHRMDITRARRLHDHSQMRIPTPGLSPNRFVPAFRRIKSAAHRQASTAMLVQRCLAATTRPPRGKRRPSSLATALDRMTM